MSQSEEGATGTFQRQIGRLLPPPWGCALHACDVCVKWSGAQNGFFLPAHKSEGKAISLGEERAFTLISFSSRVKRIWPFLFNPVDKCLLIHHCGHLQWLKSRRELKNYEQWCRNITFQKTVVRGERHVETLSSSRRPGACQWPNDTGGPLSCPLLPLCSSQAWAWLPLCLTTFHACYVPRPGQQHVFL